MVVRHMNFAEAIARRYRGSVGDPRDIQQVALLGLVKAAKRFDPDRGSAFTAFAGPTIVGEIKRHLRDAGWMVRPPRAVQELAVSINTELPELRQELGREPSEDDLAERLDVPTEDVAEAVRSGQGRFASSLDDLTWAHDEALTDRHDPMSDVERGVELRAAIARLPRKEKEVIYLRFCEGLTQREIAGKLGMSQMQVSRGIARTLAKLRRELEVDD